MRFSSAELSAVLLAMCLAVAGCSQPAESASGWSFSNSGGTSDAGPIDVVDPAPDGDDSPPTPPEEFTACFLGPRAIDQIVIRGPTGHGYCATLIVVGNGGSDGEDDEGIRVEPDFWSVAGAGVSNGTCGVPDERRNFRPTTRAEETMGRIELLGANDTYPPGPITVRAQLSFPADGNVRPRQQRIRAERIPIDRLDRGTCEF